MNDKYDPAAWIYNWPHNKITVVDAWSKVHARFGIAAQKGNELETGLVMLISQAQQHSEKRLHFDDLLEYLEKNGNLTLGRLVQIFSSHFQLSDNLSHSLKRAVKRRNYLVHHFFRHKADQFYETPEECSNLEDELFSIQNVFDDAIGLLREWQNIEFGSITDEDIWDKTNEDAAKWRQEQDAMLKAILNKKDRI